MSVLNINRKDFIVIVNSIDLTGKKFTFKEYIMNGNGYSYPVCNTRDVNIIMNAVRDLEIKNNRLIIDVPIAIDSVGNLLWDTPGIEGTLDTTIKLENMI